METPDCGRADAVGFGVQEASEEETHNGADFLAQVERVGAEVIGPNAARADQAAGPLPENFRALAEAGLFGMAIPREYGGLDAPGSVQREVTELLASQCGVTTFVQAQHHGPCRMIGNSPNIALKQRLLPDLATGHSRCGVSFAHLRRPGPPALRADPVPGGWRLNGTAPWVTGWGLINQVVFGAEEPGGRFVYIWSPAGNRAPFADLFSGAEADEDAGGKIEASAPLPLCAMNASATVELTLHDWFIPKAHLLRESNRERMAQEDRAGVLNAAAMPLGCGRASVRLLCELAEKRKLPAVSRAADAFAREWNDLKAEVLSADSADPGFFEKAILLRAHVIELALRAAHAAVTASSGAANRRDHPAQRLLREAMFYTVQAQTRDVMDATLARLERTHVAASIR